MHLAYDVIIDVRWEDGLLKGEDDLLSITEKQDLIRNFYCLT